MSRITSENTLRSLSARSGGAENVALVEQAANLGLAGQAAIEGIKDAQQTMETARQVRDDERQKRIARARQAADRLRQAAAVTRWGACTPSPAQRPPNGRPQSFGAFHDERESLPDT